MTATASAVLNPNWQKPETKEEILQQWLEAKQALDAAKNTEQALRVKVVGMFPFDASKKEGIEYIPLANGFRLKAQKNLRYILDKEKTDSVLDQIEAEGETGRLLAARLVKWEPTLSVTEYKMLPDAYRAIVDSALTTKEGMPTLELVEPKGTK